MSRVAVVLFNLGGPDGPEAVRPFLYNLFKDPAIISVPALLRYPIAALISSRRETSAQANYNIMGGASPLLPETPGVPPTADPSITDRPEFRSITSRPPRTTLAP